MTIQITNSRTDRRSFLKWAGIMLGGITLGSALWKFQQDPGPVLFKGKLYKGTLDGKVLEAASDGKNWAEKINFGQPYNVKKMSVAGNNLRAHLDFHGMPIELHTSDGQNWYMAGYQAPG